MEEVLVDLNVDTNFEKTREKEYCSMDIASVLFKIFKTLLHILVLGFLCLLLTYTVLLFFCLAFTISLLSPNPTKQQDQDETKQIVEEDANAMEDVVDVGKPNLAEDLYNIRMLEESLVQNSKYLEIVNKDSNIVQDPCSCYVTSIYDNNRVAELIQRPSSSYMEQVQRDIDPSMRAILIDWLVEVEFVYNIAYNIASDDILHLTVILIDRYLSHNYVEKSKLQLLGATCMLIACKYNDENSCVPRVEDFCDFTDNTYTKQEVLCMENQVLNFLRFRLSVPTTKTFLEQFIQVAQASDIDKVPYTDMEHLANYLAELTLLEYSFLKFLPSLIAASAVFLARWTLDQSNHPWNQTLENYTRYEMSALKSTVLAMEELQRNSSGSKLMVIRKKYNQEKYKRVAILKSPERVTTIFSRDVTNM